MLAAVASAAVVGIEAYHVLVEVDVAARGLPQWIIVGLPAGAVKESRERVSAEFPGQRLIIPRAPTLLLAANADNPPPLTETKPAEAVVAAASGAPKAPEGGKVIYRVKRGDTLSRIARVYRTTVASLKTWNRLRSNSIQVGQRLTIFTDRGATATN